MNGRQEPQPAPVLETTQQAGQIAGTAARRVRWHWVEPTVWTDRMLTALETGFEGLGKEGCGRGIDHHRWPNLLFTKHGFYSMYQAHVKACQSALR